MLTRTQVMADRGARVGLYWSEAAIITKKNAIDNDALQLDQSQDAIAKAIDARHKADKAAGKCVTDAACLTPFDRQFTQWQTQFHQWKWDWNQYKTPQPDCWVGCGITIWNSGQMDTFDDRLKVLRATFEKLSGSKLVVPDSPSDGDAVKTGPAASVDKFFGSLTTIVWIVGIGIVTYFGLVYVAPSLLGAAAKTKAAGRALKEA